MGKSDEISHLINSRRTIRQFKQDSISLRDLLKCIKSAGLAPSAENLQPLEYLLITDSEKVKTIFPLLKWAGYIAPNGNPEEGRRPTAYLIVLVNKSIKKTGAEHDAGAAIENFILSAWSFGIGSCWIVSVNREKLQKVFNIPDTYLIDSVIALGYPDESPVVEAATEDIKYWKDKIGVLHVPKRPIEDILQINEWKKDNIHSH